MLITLTNYIQSFFPIRTTISFLDLNNGNLPISCFKIHLALSGSRLFALLEWVRSERATLRRQVIQLRGIVDPYSVEGGMPSLNKMFVAFLRELRLQGIGSLIKALIIIWLDFLISFLCRRPSLIKLGPESIDIPPKLTGALYLPVAFFWPLCHLAFSSLQVSLGALSAVLSGLYRGWGLLLKSFQPNILLKRLTEMSFGLEQLGAGLKNPLNDLKTHTISDENKESKTFRCNKL